MTYPKLATTLTAALITLTLTTTATAQPELNRPGLEALGQCEADTAGGYTANTGNGYYGRYQFNPTTWNATINEMVNDGAPTQWLTYLAWLNEAEPEWRNTPNQAPPFIQDQAAQWLWNNHGPQHWPQCQHPATTAATNTTPPPQPEAPTPKFAG